MCDLIDSGVERHAKVVGRLTVSNRAKPGRISFSCDSWQQVGIEPSWPFALPLAFLVALAGIQVHLDEVWLPLKNLRPGVVDILPPGCGEVAVAGFLPAFSYRLGMFAPRLEGLVAKSPCLTSTAFLMAVVAAERRVAELTTTGGGWRTVSRRGATVRPGPATA